MTRSTQSETSSLRIQGNRLWSSLMEMAEIGGTPAGGCNRQALTDEDRRGRDLFVRWCEQAELDVRVDQIGNLFARRAGRDRERATIFTASHLDTQPTGGKFDGVLGALAGLEVIRTLNDHQIETEAPFEIASWTNEEGVRFPPAMMGSGTFTGVFGLEETYSIGDRDGKRVGDELERIGYRGDVAATPYAIEAAFELHIEQGPILEQRQKQIGIVTGVQAMRWLDVVIEGQAAHAGTTPMESRRDPMKALGGVLPRMYGEAEALGTETRLTFGELCLTPGSRNTVPDRLEVTVDMRHPESSVLDLLQQALTNIVREETEASGTGGRVEAIWSCPAVSFAPRCVEAVRAAAEIVGAPAIEMMSGAGHDAVYLSTVAPSSMIFVPCAGGLSHNEAESIEPADAEAGANVLLHAMLACDRGVVKSE